MTRNIPNPSRLSIGKKIILIFFGMVMSLCTLEIGLRIGGRLFLSYQEYINRLAIYKKGTFRIMCLGESTTAGGNDSYPFQLETILNEEILNRNLPKVKFSVINKGIVGDNSSTILSQLENNLRLYKPQMVIAMMGINDKHIKYYEDISERNTFLFNRLRSFRLLRLIWKDIMSKQKREVFCKTAAIENKPEAEKGDIQSGLMKGGINPRRVNLEEMISKKFRELKPEVADSVSRYLALGLLYKSQGKHLESERQLLNAADLAPPIEFIFYELGRCYRNLGRYVQAEKALRKAIDLNPQYNWAYLVLGQCYQRQKKYQQAVEMFKKALEIEPGSDAAYIALGWAYQYQAKYQEAEAVFKKAIELNPNNYEAYGGLTVLYTAAGRSDIAQEYSEKANRLSLQYYPAVTVQNYQKLKKNLDQRGIKLICVQYPLHSIEPLKRIFEGQEGIIFVDNEKIFREAVAKEGFKEYFLDMFAGDFGHCTYRGNRLLAENIARVLLKEYLNK